MAEVQPRHRKRAEAAYRKAQAHGDIAVGTEAPGPGGKWPEDPALIRMVAYRAFLDGMAQGCADTEEALTEEFAAAVELTVFEEEDEAPWPQEWAEQLAEWVRSGTWRNRGE